MINQNGGLKVKNITYQIQIVAHSISNASDPYWTTSGSRIKFDPVKKIWFKNYGQNKSASSDLRQYWQQQRLFNGYIYLYIDVYLYICMYMSMCIYIYLNAYIYICIYIHKYIYKYKYKHMYMYT
jgi:hypothetical protein